MNKQFLKLAEQAGLILSVDQQVAFQRAAKLIVQECAEIANSKAEGIDLARELYLYTTDIEYAIKEHFGVEE